MEEILKERGLYDYGINDAPEVFVKIEGESGVLLRATVERVKKSLQNIGGNVSLEVNGIKQLPYGMKPKNRALNSEPNVG